MSKTEKEVDRFDAVDSDGVSHIILAMQTFSRFVPTSGDPASPSGSTSYVTAQGRELNAIADGVFSDVLNGKILSRVR